MSNLRSYCQCAHLIARDFFSILTNVEYKHKMAIIQFFIDLTWNLNEAEKSAQDQEKKDTVVSSIQNLFQLVDVLNVFNPIEDQNNGDIFKIWCKAFVQKTLHGHKFNAIFAEYLISIIKIDHLFLESEMGLILERLQVENNMSTFLHAYLEANVKFRQMSRVTHKMFELLKSNTGLVLPQTFYDFYGECLESHQVDSQTVVSIWKEINKCLQETSGESNIQSELVKFLNCVLSRVNLCNSRIPTHLKTQSMQLLNENKVFLSSFLANINDLDARANDDLITYLKCYYTCGLVYIVVYRYSLNSDSQSQTVVHQTECFNDVKVFLGDLDEKLKLLEKLSMNFNVLFYLNQLQLLNVYALNTIDDKEISSSKVLESLFRSEYNLNALYKADTGTSKLSI